MPATLSSAMGIRIYLKGRTLSLNYGPACRIEWESISVPANRYGKEVATPEAWCVLYSDSKPGSELARFRAADVAGYSYFHS